MAERTLKVVIAGDASNATRAVEGFSKKMDRVGKNLTRRVTLPLLAAGAAVGKLGVDFDDSMQKIVSLVGLSQETVDGMKASVLDLAGDTAKAPAELADAMFFITSAGLRGKDALEALEASAKASAAGLGDTATVADAVTSAMNAYGPEALSATEATDVLVAAVREGKLEAADLSGSLGKVIPIASELGISFDQVGASIATMSRIGIGAEEGTTALRSVMSTLLKPTAAAEETLEEFGTSAADLRQRVKDDGLLAVLIDLKDRFGDNEEAMAKVFPNVRALTGVLATVGKNSESAEQIFASLADTTGTLDASFESASSTAGFAARQAFVELKTSAVDLAGSLVPAIRAAADALKGMAAWFRNLSPETKEMVVRMAAVAAAVGPVLIIAAKLVQAFKIVKGAFIALKVVMMANPWVLLIAATVALVVLIVKNWDKITAFLTKVWDKIKAAASSVGSWLKNTFKSAVDFLVGLFLNFTPLGLFIKHMDSIKAAVTGVKDWVFARIGDIVGFFRDMPGRISRVIGGLFDGLKTAFRNAVNWVIDKWNNFSLGIDLPGILGGGRIALDTPNIPRLHQGGVFQAPPGQSEGLALLEDGERVISARGGDGPLIGQVNIQGRVDPLSVADVISWKLRTAGV